MGWLEKGYQRTLKYKSNLIHWKHFQRAEDIYVDDGCNFYDAAQKNIESNTEYEQIRCKGNDVPKKYT